MLAVVLMVFAGTMSVPLAFALFGRDSALMDHLQAMAITLLNPKAILFYMAFFPLFVDPARQQGLLTYGFMAATIAVLTFFYGLTSTLLTHFLAERVRANPVISRVLEKVAGLCLVGFGIKLAISR